MRDIVENPIFDNYTDEIHDIYEGFRLFLS